MLRRTMWKKQEERGGNGGGDAILADVPDHLRPSSFFPSKLLRTGKSLRIRAGSRGHVKTV